jgi:hypothetical protein
MTRIHTTVAAVEQMAAVNHVEPVRSAFFASVVLGGVVYWAAA